MTAIIQINGIRSEFLLKCFADIYFGVRLFEWRKQWPDIPPSPTGIFLFYQKIFIIRQICRLFFLSTGSLNACECCILRNVYFTGCCIVINSKWSVSYWSQTELCFLMWICIFVYPYIYIKSPYYDIKSGVDNISHKFSSRNFRSWLKRCCYSGGLTVEQHIAMFPSLFIITISKLLKIEK